MASVTYRINGKSDNKAVDETKKSLESLGGVAKNLNTLFKGFMALKAVQAIGSQVNESLKAFQIQQKAISQLSIAIGNNAKMSAGALQRLVDFTSQLQGMSIYGDEQLQAQAAFLSGMQLTEDQIKTTLQAAADLAAGGIGNLESNVRNLAKTYSGAAGELAEMVPGLRNLTREQLAHGDAVRLVSERYKGFASAMTGTLDGKQQQITNLIGDIKEKVGALAAIGKSAFMDTVKPYLEQMNAWLGANLGRIANVFLNLPGVVNAAMVGIGKMIRETFKPENLAVIKDSLSNAIANGVRIGVTFMVSIFSTLGDIFKQIGDTLGNNLGKSLINAWYKAFMSNPLYRVLEFIPGEVGEAFKKARGFKPYDLTAEFGDVALTAITDNFGKAIAAAKTAVVDMAGNYGNLAAEIGKIYQPVVDEIIAEWNRITDLPLPPAVQALVDAAAGVANDLASVGTTTAGTANAGGTGYSPFGGQIGGIGDIFGSMASGMMGAIGAVIELAKQFESVTMLMDPMGTILAAIIEVIQPVVDQLLAPLVGILKTVGFTIGQVLVPVLQLVTPIIEIMSEAFVWLYNNAIMPLGNFIIGLIVEINNFFAGMINEVIGWLNAIPFVNIGWRMGTMDYNSLALKEIDSSTLSSTGSASSASTGSSSSASYTGAKDMYINIYFDRSYVNGDAREIALMLRDEINAAEALGY